MERVSNVATPATAARVSVPERVPPPGLLPSATVTFAVEPVWFPNASRRLTCTPGAMEVPAVALEGCTVKTSWEAAPAPMVNALLVIEVNPIALADNAYVPDVVRERSVNVAIPPTAVREVVPPRVAPGGPPAMARATVALLLVWLPKASTIATCTAGERNAPATAPVGCCRYASAAAGPGRMSKGSLGMAGRPAEAAESA